jgi:hypothetical protein
MRITSGGGGIRSTDPFDSVALALQEAPKGPRLPEPLVENGGKVISARGTTTLAEVSSSAAMMSGMFSPQTASP